MNSPDTELQVSDAGLDDLTQSVIRSLAHMLQCDTASLTPQTRLFDDLSLDSTAVLELLMQLEADLDMEFDPETLEPDDFETVKSLVLYAAKYIEG